MNKYECKCCNYVTVSRYNMNRHLLSSKHMKLFLNDNLNVNSFDKNDSCFEKNANRDKKEIKCIFCNETFTTRSAKSRHQNHRCKYRQDDKSGKSETLKSLTELTIELTKQIKVLQNEISEMKKS